MFEYIAPEFTAAFSQYELSFDKLWHMQIGAVDEPNKRKNGWSQVSYLELGDLQLFLHRQENYYTRTFYQPLGEPTFKREFRATLKFEKLGIPAMRSAYFAQQEKKAILITYALTGYKELGDYLQHWQELTAQQQDGIIIASATLAKTLHQAGQIHGCFYPKHVFLKPLESNKFEARFIDLEKTRPLLLGKRDRIRDLETLKRRSNQTISKTHWHLFLKTYLGEEGEVEKWLQAIEKRQSNKEQRL